MAPMTTMPTRKVTCNLARPAATKTNRVVAGARKAHGKTQQVATAAGVSVAVGTTVLAQSAHAANEVAEVAATFNLADSQVFGAIFISLIAGILATRLGAELYK